MRRAQRSLTVGLVGLLSGLVLASTVAVAPPASAASSTDDYPYRADTGQSADNWGFTKRQCVSFAAWRLAQHHHAVNNAQNWGSALHWDVTARHLGFRVSSRPVVGAVAQWHAHETSAWYANGSRTPNGTVQAGGYGHVAFVRSVLADGSVLVEQYNMTGTRSYSTMHLKAPRYLYIGV